MPAFRPFIGSDDFDEIRRGKYPYVDKSGFLNDFLDPLTARVVLLTRPRRFGRSLFLSMLASFFDITKDSRALFTGLRVAANRKLCRQWMNRCPVVDLTLKDVSADTFHEAVSALALLIRDFCSRHRYLATSGRVPLGDRTAIRRFLERTADISLLRRSLSVLTRALSLHHGNGAVVLVDEYDVPAKSASGHGCYEETVEFMNGFLSAALTSDVEHLRFCVLAGSLHLPGKSLYPCLDRALCLDIFSSEAGESVGFTPAEVDGLLARAGYGDGREKLLEWCGGYRFGRRPNVCNPLSVLRYLRDAPRGDALREAPGIRWQDTDDHLRFGESLSRLGPEIQDDVATLLDGGSVTARLDRASYRELSDTPRDRGGRAGKDTGKDSFLARLLLNGRLTVADDTVTDGTDRAVSGTPLVLPNREFATFFEEGFRIWVREIVPDLERSRLLRLFRAGDARGYADLLEDLLARCPFFHDHGYGEPLYRHLVRHVLTGDGNVVTESVVTDRGNGTAVRLLVLRNGREGRAALVGIGVTDREESPDVRAEDVLRGLESMEIDAFLPDLRDPGIRNRTRVLLGGMAFHRKTCRMKARRAT